jgi:hypothetical protein
MRGRGRADVRASLVLSWTSQPINLSIFQAARGERVPSVAGKLFGLAFPLSRCIIPERFGGGQGQQWTAI